MAKLEKCPLCKVEPETIHDDDFKSLVSIGCVCCTMGTGFLPPESAEKTWNDFINCLKKEATK